MMLMIESKSGESQPFTLIHNNAHSNISSLFDEENNRVPENDTLTLVRGVLGSYPAAYLSLRNEILTGGTFEKHWMVKSYVHATGSVCGAS